MAGLIAPINMVPESGQEIAEQIKSSILGPLQQGQEYQSLLGQQPGLNIGPDMPKLAMGLMRALGLMDPSGMMGGPAGAIVEASPQLGLLGKLLYGRPGQIQKAQSIADIFEKAAPAIGVPAKEASVFLSSSKGLGNTLTQRLFPWLGGRTEGIASSALNTANILKSITIPHEELHLAITKNPALRDLSKSIGQYATKETKDILGGRGRIGGGYSPKDFSEELLAGAIDKLVGSKSLSRQAFESIPESDQLLGLIRKEIGKAPTGTLTSTGVGSTKLLKSEVEPSGILRRAKDFFDRTFFEHTESPLHGKEIIWEDKTGYLTGSPGREFRGLKWERAWFPWTDEELAQLKQIAKERKTTLDPGNLGQYRNVPAISITETGKNIVDAVDRPLFKIGDKVDISKVYKEWSGSKGVNTPEGTGVVNLVVGENAEVTWPNGKKTYERIGDLLKSERGSFSNKPIGRTAIKEQKDIIKNKEIMDVIKEAMRGPNKKGGGMIVNKPGKLSEYLEETPRPTSYNPETGARRWEF